MNLRNVLPKLRNGNGSGGHCMITSSSILYIGVATSLLMNSQLDFPLLGIIIIGHHCFVHFGTCLNLMCIVCSDRLPVVVLGHCWLRLSTHLDLKVHSYFLSNDHHHIGRKICYYWFRKQIITNKR